MFPTHLILYCNYVFIGFPPTVPSETVDIDVILRGLTKLQNIQQLNRYYVCFNATA